jgi:hypothetical protein
MGTKGSFVCNSASECQYKACTSFFTGCGEGSKQYMCQSQRCSSYTCSNNYWVYCPDPCDALVGYYCPSGSSTITACPAGSYCTGGRAIVACPQGQTSPANSPSSASCYVTCSAPIGKYCLTETSMTDCPKGFYCAGGVTLPVACPAGKNGTTDPLEFCKNCSNAPKEGEYQWKLDKWCEFQCNIGYYMVFSVDNNMYITIDLNNETLEELIYI